MARSSYVYVLKTVDKVNGEGALISAYTVKHELLTAIERGLECGDFKGVDLYVIRYRDGIIDWSQGMPVDWAAEVIF